MFEYDFLPVGLRLMPPVDMASVKLAECGYTPKAIRAWATVAKQLMVAQIALRLEDRTN